MEEFTQETDPFIAALLIFSPKILYAEFMQSNTFHTRILRGKNWERREMQSMRNKSFIRHTPIDGLPLNF